MMDDDLMELITEKEAWPIESTTDHVGAIEQISKSKTDYMNPFCLIILMLEMNW